MLENKGNATGQILGKYRLLRLLGQGGFADVYLGEHVHLGTRAAIKVLHTRMTEDDADQFRQEARTIGSLVHPHIVRVLDYDVEEMTPFLVMDYAPGGTLRQRHPKGSRLPLSTIAEYVKQLASALQYAHDQKLIHRDIKPENMLIDQHNNIVLSDFGVASIAHSTESQTVVEMAGTIPYIAPEQLQGLPRTASDQYALAIVVYEWISGERPFQGTFTEILSQHLIKTPDPLYERIPNVPRVVDQIVLMALSKDPHHRFPSIEAFATAFERAIREPHAVISTTHLPDILSHTEDIEELPTRSEQAVEVRAPYATLPIPAQAPITPVPSFLKLEQDLFSNTPSTLEEASNSSSQQQIQSSSSFVTSAKATHTGRSHWKLMIAIVPLILILLSGGFLYTLSYTKSLPNNANTQGNTNQIESTVTAETYSFTATASSVHATATSQFQATATSAANTQATATSAANTQATASAQTTATVGAVQKATAQAQATRQAIAQSTVAAQATATALSSTPQGLYMAIVNSPPALSDPLSAQSAVNWDNGGQYCNFKGGKYHIALTSSYAYIVCHAIDTNFCNQAYQVQMSVVNGDGGGIVIRSNGNKQYRFHVGVDGTYDLVNSNIGLVSGSSSAIKKGAGAVNILTIIAQDNKFHLYINSEYIQSVTDNATNCGRIGLMSVSAANVTEVAFSNAKVWLL